MTDPDESLRQKLRSRMDLKGADSETETESTDTEQAAEHEDEEDDDMEMDMSDDVQEAAQMIAEAADASPEQVLEMLGPMLGEDARDDEAEMAAEDEAVDADEIVADAREAAADAAEEVVSEAIPDDVVTEDELDSKLTEAVDTLADETRDVLQKAEVGATPTPSENGAAGGITKADLFSDMEADE